MKEHPREFALLHQLDPESKGIESQKLTEYADRGDESKVKELAGKSEASFEDFAAAFKKTGPAVDGKGNCLAWAARDSTGELAPFKFDRRELRADDVCMQVTYCGMCHSDVHQIKDDWGNSKFPMVPGHECLGVVVDVGKEVSKFKPGDLAAVGCMVDSCGSCERCKQDDEQYCMTGMTPTYNGKYADGEVAQGGYSTYMVVKEHFVLRSQTACTRRPPRPCCALASPSTHPCATTVLTRRGRRSRSWAWVGWATWWSSSQRLLGSM